MSTFTWADGPFPLIPTSKTTKPDVEPIGIFLSDDMANVHNMMLRQLNSMYLQAPHVSIPADQADLCQYAVFWHETLHAHHQLEENGMFPAIDEITGEKGIMERNVSQHHEFTPAMDAFGQYASDVLAGKKTYDGKTFVGLIDAFGPALAKHLTEEIQTLLALGKYDAKKLKAAYMRFEVEARSAPKAVLFPMCVSSVDVDYEGGNTWPNLPFFFVFAIDWYFQKKHQSVWRFSPCDMHGHKRPLLFLPLPEGTEGK
jgi:hypothetical protein